MADRRVLVRLDRASCTPIHSHSRMMMRDHFLRLLSSQRKKSGPCDRHQAPIELPFWSFCVTEVDSSICGESINNMLEYNIVAQESLGDFEDCATA